MKILSRKPLSDSDFEKIETILQESNCPHESLKNTFPRYSGIFDNVITFDGVNPVDVITFDGVNPVEFVEEVETWKS